MNSEIKEVIEKTVQRVVYNNSQTIRVKNFISDQLIIIFSA